MRRFAWLSPLLLGGLAHALSGQAVMYRFNRLPPGPPDSRQVLVSATNDSGNMVGLYWRSSAPHGFYLDSVSSGEYSTIDFPGASYTAATGINDNKEIAGYYGAPGSRKWVGSVAPGDHGYVYRGTQFATLDYPNSTGTRLEAINNSGDAIGESLSPPVGFIYSNGRFQAITCPDSKPARPIGLNNKGEVVGMCAGQRAFLLSSGVVSMIDLHAPFPVDQIVPSSINDNGDIAGLYFVNKTRHGFVLIHGPNPEFVLVDDGPNTLVHGINNRKQIVGFGPTSFFGEPETGISTHQ